MMRKRTSFLSQSSVEGGRVRKSQRCRIPNDICVMLRFVYNSLVRYKQWWPLEKVKFLINSNPIPQVNHSNRYAARDEVGKIFFVVVIVESFVVVFFWLLMLLFFFFLFLTIWIISARVIPASPAAFFAL